MKIAIYGYGNLGKGVECAVKYHTDCELVGVFTRRAPETVKTVSGVPVFSADKISEFKNKIDVLILCGGSATDLPEMTPALARDFNVVDSFDTHARIPEHFANVNKSALESNHTALISAGWDPGLFSILRAYSSAVLPNGKDYTFWGRGVSQGHSDAIRRIEGVLDARQYTVPVNEALAAVRSGNNPELTTREKHTRECYVVAEEGADLARIENEIKTMPNYFADYDTTVTFITADELKKEVSRLVYEKDADTDEKKEYYAYARLAAKEDLSRSSFFNTFGSLYPGYGTLVKPILRACLGAEEVGSFELDQPMTRKRLLGVCNMLAWANDWSIEFADILLADSR